MIVMVGAAYAHTRLREPGPVAVNIELFASWRFVLVARLVQLAG